MNKIIKRGTDPGGVGTGHPAVRPVVLLGVEELAGSGGGALAHENPVARARREADVIIRTARSEAEAITENAYSEGYKSGRRAGAAEAGELIERLELLIAQVERDLAGLASSLEPQVLKLCMEMVEKIVRHEVKTDPRVVERTVKSCLRRVKDSHEVRIRVSPAEVEQVRALKDELLGIADGVRALHVVDDKRVSPGGCVIETASGTFDADIKTQTEKLNQKVMETYENDLRREDGPTDARPDQV